MLPSPIGNLGDLSERFIEVLSAAGAVAAEDTRRTLKLLSHLGLKKRIYGYREENHRILSPKLLRHLEDGDIVALLSDAGAPGICDPGALLVTEAREAGWPVYPIPGPSAVVTALMASGFEISRFSFLGFLPPKSDARRKALEKVKDRPEVLVAFIPPHKLTDTLADLLAVLGPRPAFMAREMTKVHEEYLRLNLDGLLAEVTANPRRGEVTLVIGQDKAKPTQIAGPESLDGDSLKLINSDTRPTKDAAAHYAKEFGISKKDMYDFILGLRGNKNRRSDD